MIQSATRLSRRDYQNYSIISRKSKQKFNRIKGKRNKGTKRKSDLDKFVLKYSYF